MTRYEYRVLRTGELADDALARELSALGAEGWRIVHTEQYAVVEDAAHFFNAVTTICVRVVLMRQAHSPKSAADGSPFCGCGTLSRVGESTRESSVDGKRYKCCARCGYPMRAFRLLGVNER